VIQVLKLEGIRIDWGGKYEKNNATIHEYSIAFYLCRINYHNRNDN
jgi:hypothetical protein